MLALSRKCVAVLLPLVCLSGCGSDDEFTADVAGNYTIAVTNGASSCNFDKWVEGNSTPNIGFVVTQDGKNLHGSIDGIVGLLFVAYFGSADFDGTVSGDSFSLTNYGQNPVQSGNCSYTYNSTVQASQTGDTITGTITYSTKTNGNPDCEAVECSATQKFNGTRPPS